MLLKTDDEVVTDNRSLVFRFEDIEVRAAEFLILRSGKPLPMEPKAFAVLVYLLEHRGHLVPKDKIMDAVWKDASVSGNSLTRSVATLRRVLRDDARSPRFIATVQTLGYRFLCPVEVHVEPEVDAPNVHELRESAALVEPQPYTVKAAPAANYRGTLILAVVGVAMLIIAFASWSMRTVAHNLPPSASSSPHARPLTSLTGAVWSPEFSPDGNQIVYAWDGENAVRGDLYVQQVGGRQVLRLTHTLHGYLYGATWSPDSLQIAFERCQDGGGSVWVVSALGGPEHKVTDIECPTWHQGRPVWIEAGKALLLNDRCASGSPSGLVVFTLSTGERRCLHSPPAGDLGDGEHVASPNGKQVAFIESSASAVTDLYTVPIAGGRATRVTFDAKTIGGVMWAHDGAHLIFESNRSGLSRIWRISGGGGVIEPETEYPGVGALSRDGNRLAYVEPAPFLRWTSEIWRADLDAKGKVVSLIKALDSAGSNHSPQLSPDQQHILFTSNRSGNGEVWKSGAHGDDPAQVTTFSGHAGTPRWSPDGRSVAFDYGPGKHSQIFLSDAEGRNARPVTAGDSENVVPSWSRDGASIYFSSNRSGDYEVWNVVISTGQLKQVTHHGGFAAFESADSKTLFYTRFYAPGLWAIPLSGGQEHRIIDAPHIGYWGHFAVSEKAIYVVDTETSPHATILAYNLDTGQMRPVLQMAEDPIPWHADLNASPDGRILLFTQGRQRSSLTLVENLR